MGDIPIAGISSKWYDLGLRANIALLSGILGGLLFGYAITYVNHESFSGALWWLVSALALVIALYIIGAFLSNTRIVILSTKGVTFVVGMGETLVQWGDLIPPHYPFQGYVVFGGRVRGRKYIQTFTAKLPQAQAILSHPSCPKFKLKKEIWLSLKMDPPKAEED